ncbi:MAG: hypothetical protein A2X45_03550 [Lentisphaerae bacterium GWF2_50_93]|nr:MAG: hypothetical protein A2X45_03550 [Lentisphaerae bacterium GWF2_50_93]
MKSKILSAISAIFLIVGAFSVVAAEPRSALYPVDWKPGFALPTGERLQDFSYAGYRGGGVPLPEGDFLPVIDVSQQPYGAVADGKTDAQPAIQAALDAAAKQGGAIVFLPAGLYRLDNDLRATASKIVLRGAGGDKTKLWFSAAGDNNHSFLRFRSPDYKQAVRHYLTADANVSDRVLHVKDTDGITVGDDVVIGFSLTERYKAEHGMEKLWTIRKTGAWVERFWRSVTAVAADTIEVDVPLRYPVRLADKAAVSKVEGVLAECGVEYLGIGNVAPMDDAWTRVNSNVIQFWGARDSWVRDVRSFAPPGSERYHLQSKGIQICESKRMTVADCVLENPQNRNGGGNGYLYEISRCDEVLVTDCVGRNGRHNFTVNGAMGATGCVFRRLVSEGGFGFMSYDQFKEHEAGNAKAGFTAYPDVHMGLTIAILIDNCRLEDGWDARNRGEMSNKAGITTTDSVFWNNRGAGRITSFQYKFGYVIGSGPQLKVITDEKPLPAAFAGTAPADYCEHLGEMVEPLSLYDDQLARRLGVKAKQDAPPPVGAKP